MPSRRQPGGYVNSSRIYLRAAMERFAERTKAGMLVLDAGAGKGPYRDLFSHAHYEAADFAQLKTSYTELDYVCDLTDIPVEDNRFDRIILNQVLEHVPDPSDVLAELFRTMKPGGRIFCSCPLFFREHQIPYDYFRYTRYGLRWLFDDAGFEILRIKRLEGYFGTVAYQFRQMYFSLPANGRALKCGWRAIYMTPLLWTTRAMAYVFMQVYSRADLRWMVTNRGMPKNYIVVARKPLTTAADPPSGDEVVERV